MASESSFKELQDNVTVALVGTTKTASQIASEDLSFLRTSNPRLGRSLAKQNARLLEFARGLLRTAVDGTDIHAPDLPHAESVDDDWRKIVDVIDSLLEKADICLDDYTGAVVKPVNQEFTEKFDNRKRSLQSRNLPKPQLHFNKVPKNDEKTPFKPLLGSKPHALVPLAESISPSASAGNREQFKHPYEHEINQYRYPSSLYTHSDPTPPLPFEATTATFVDTVKGVHEMIEELKKAKEIAVDLEHHDARTYVGLVSLMQISTRNRDWIVDTLKPWREELQILNEVFADPSIVKVLHGAHMDIIWLQRDLGLYVVGLFDTYHAARSLGYPRHSLAFLLSKFVNFDAQKQYQMADWRTRPLTKELFEYARSDTHFLLYIFDNLCNELLEKAKGSKELIDTVLEESKTVALQRYERFLYDSEQGMGDRGWYFLLIKTPALFNKQQFSVFRAAHKWRDEVARKEDESLHYVMQNSALFNVAREMPSQIPQLLGSLSKASEPVRRRVSELLEVIKKAKAQGLQGPEMKDFIRDHPVNIEYQARKAARLEARAAANKQPSLAEVAKREIYDVSSDQLKMEISQFWGPTMNGHKRQRLDGPENSQHLVPYLQVPLPNLTAEVYAIDGEGQVEGPKPSIMPEHPLTKTQRSADDEVFTLREANNSKKRKIAEQAEFQTELPDRPAEAPADIIDLASSSDSEHEQEVSEEPPQKGLEDLPPQRKRKSEERAAKRIAKAIITQKSTKGKGGEQPFDYAGAPSVLHAKHDTPRKGQVPAFNPYAKSLEAPKGLPRKKKELAGTSMTFKR